MKRRPGAARKEAVAHATLIQSVVDGFLTRIAELRFDDAAAMLRPAGLVRLIGPDQDWRGRGEPGRKRLVDTLSTDPALRGRQVRADIHPAVPLVTVFASYQLPDGSVEDRVFVVGADRSAVTHITYYYRSSAAPPHT